MEILYLLVPLALVLVGLIAWAYMWSIKSGQFDDLEGPAHRIIMDRDDPPVANPPPGGEKKKS
jgi:cbb3-type cytochrome oxidase maturation protein